MVSIVNNRLHNLHKLFGYEPKHFASTSGFSSAALAKHSRHVLTKPPNNEILMAFEKAVRGGYSSIMQRLSLDTCIIPGPKVTPYLWNDKTKTMEKRNFYCKLLKCDENNQYGFSMTKKIPTGGIRPVQVENLKDYVLEEILPSYDEKNANIGYLLSVDLDAPAEKDTIEIALCEAFIPILERTEMPVVEMSTMFLHSHTTFRERNRNIPNKISPTLKTHSTLRPRIEECIFAQRSPFSKDQILFLLCIEVNLKLRGSHDFVPFDTWKLFFVYQIPFL